MGKIVVEIPQPGNLHFNVSDENDASVLVAFLERLSKEHDKPSSGSISFDDVIGIWSDQFGLDEAVEAAREVRDSWNRH
ncbi:MAG TPA: hypothetical protein VFC63_03160 [Blastocatellia bacterium]|nr:hypothetical protein [Blastocatellia bacterium]